LAKSPRGRIWTKFRARPAENQLWKILLRSVQGFRFCIDDRNSPFSVDQDCHYRALPVTCFDRQKHISPTSCGGDFQQLTARSTFHETFPDVVHRSALSTLPQCVCHLVQWKDKELARVGSCNVVVKTEIWADEVAGDGILQRLSCAILIQPQRDDYLTNIGRVFGWRLPPCCSRQHKQHNQSINQLMYKRLTCDQKLTESKFSLPHVPN